MNVQAYFDAELGEHADLVDACRIVLAEPLEAMLATWTNCIVQGGKIFFFGNGGSAADAQHLAAELSIRYKKDRAPIAGIALTTDSSVLTAAGNDMGFDTVFSRQIEALGRVGDVAVGISTSGKSSNVINGLRAARRVGLVATALGGCTGGRLHEVADPVLIVPSSTTARIQEVHIMMGHILCGALEVALGLVPETSK